MRLSFAPAAAAALFLTFTAQAQPAEGWHACAGIGEAPQRLACFDRWAESQRPAPAATAPAPLTAATPARPTAPEPRRGLRLTASEGCRDTRYSELSRFWELEPGADCGTFGIRGYRPISLDLVGADTVTTQPTSGNPANNPATATDYRTTETRLQLSVRTKIAQGLLKAAPDGLDSLWFGYTQQSYWQLFTPSLSRPFRSTDHEPELVYVLPLQPADPDRWRLRFGGVGIVHQSNGQSLPYSRSWNRVYLMAGAESGRLQVHGRVWNRINEDAPNDDNPEISNLVGRAEARVVWHQSRTNLFAVTARHSLRRQARGSVRVEWFRSLWDDGDGPLGGLHLHTQFFSGYGDTLLDYNRRRNVFSIGLSLVEW